MTVQGGIVDPRRLAQGPPTGNAWRFDAASGGFVADTFAIAGGLTDLTDNSGGTANTTIQALPDPADTPATADALRDDLVANLLPALRNNIADLTARLNALVP